MVIPDHKIIFITNLTNVMNHNVNSVWHTGLPMRMRVTGWEPLTSLDRYSRPGCPKRNSHGWVYTGDTQPFTSGNLTNTREKIFWRKNATHLAKLSAATHLQFQHSGGRGVGGDVSQGYGDSAFKTKHLCWRELFWLTSTHKASLSLCWILYQPRGD